MVDAGHQVIFDGIDVSRAAQRADILKKFVGRDGAEAVDWDILPFQGARSQFGSSRRYCLGKFIGLALWFSNKRAALLLSCWQIVDGTVPHIMKDITDAARHEEDCGRLRATDQMQTRGGDCALGPHPAAHRGADSAFLCTANQRGNRGRDSACASRVQP